MIRSVEEHHFSSIGELTFLCRGVGMKSGELMYWSEHVAHRMDFAFIWEEDVLVSRYAYDGPHG